MKNIKHTQRAFALTLIASALLCVFDANAQTQVTPAPEPTFTVTAFKIEGTNPLGDQRAQDIVRPFLGEQHGLSGLESATAALENALRAGGYGLYRVTIPPQETIDVVTLKIVPIPITAVKVAGNKYYGEANVRASVPGLAVGQSPNMREVARQLAVSNENATKRTTLRVKENDTGDGIDATLDVVDHNPLSATIGINNTGTDDTTRTRVVGYLEYDNLFDRDMVLGFAATTAPQNANNVRQYGLYYKAPIYAWGGVVSASYSYSSVNSGALGSGQEITGRGTTAGIAYTQFLHPVGDYKSSLAVGLDDKVFRAPVIAGITLPIGDVRSRPISLTYQGNWTPAALSLSGSAEIATNIASGTGNDNATYALNRVGATDSWTALRGGYTLNVPLPHGFAFASAVRAQYSPDTLISGEQFGLGGASSVRGLPERAITGDTGMSSSIELYTPEVLTANLRFLTFLDGGFIVRHNVQPGESGRDGVASVGLGLRYQWLQQATVSLDFGRLINGSQFPLYRTGTERIHGNILYRF